MFKVQFFVEDKVLGPIIALLDGCGVKELTQQHIVNAVVEKGKVTAALKGNNSLELFEHYLRKDKIEQIDMVGIRTFVKHIGKAPKYCYGLAAKAKKSGLLRQHKRRGPYQVRLSK